VQAKLDAGGNTSPLAFAGLLTGSVKDSLSDLHAAVDYLSSPFAIPSANGSQLFSVASLEVVLDQAAGSVQAKLDAGGNTSPLAFAGLLTGTVSFRCRRKLLLPTWRYR
jgi:hypothetical protein